MENNTKLRFSAIDAVAILVRAIDRVACCRDVRRAQQNNIEVQRGKVAR